MGATNGHAVVIKLGGAALPHCDAVVRDLAAAREAGLQPILVHGGGPVISAWLKRIGKQTTFVDGLRVTDAETLEVATMALAGKVNKELVATLNLAGIPAVGLAGADGGWIRARRITDPDLGFVGEVVSVDPTLALALIAADYLPVVAPIALGDKGLLNVNADTVAGDIARAVDAALLIFLTDVPGVKDASNVVATHLTATQVRSMRDAGTIDGGMIPKVQACLRAAEVGARAVIADGADPGAIGIHVRGEAGNGTTISA
jgi:acetylglutamate kinase